MIRALFIALMLVAPPAFASSDNFPALYDVRGVANNDVLNIRAEPNSSAEIIGGLASDATGIEVIRPDVDFGWGLVNYGEGPGWVALNFLERQPGQWQSITPEVRQCFGTEPFWSLAVDAPRVTLSAPDITPRPGVISSVYRSRSNRNRFAETGALFPGPWGDRDLTLNLRLEECNDGMSDREYGIAVDLLIQRPTNDGDSSMTGFFSGCCSLSPPPAE